MWQTLAALPRTLLRMVSGPLPYVRLCAVGGLGPLLLVLGCAQASEEPGEDSTARPPAPSPAGPTTSVVSELSAEPEPSASQPTTPAAPPPVKPPSWASFGQPRLVASYFEKGKIGPLVLEASGVHRGALICKVTAASGGWDQAMPFVGTGVETLPDLRVWIGDKTGTILGNTLQGYVFLREIDLRPGTPVRVRLEDVDVTSVQTLIDAELPVRRLMGPALCRDMGPGRRAERLHRECRVACSMSIPVANMLGSTLFRRGMGPVSAGPGAGAGVCAGLHGG
jgi:hypothetical protein